MRRKIKEQAKKAIQTISSPQGPVPFGWPPVCTGLFYQPDRPYIKLNPEV